MMLLKCCTQFVSKFGKLSSGHRTGKGQSSSQFPRRAVLKNVQNTTIGLISHLQSQHPSSQASALCELRTFRCLSWIQKKQKNQRSNCQQTLDHRINKGISCYFYYFCFTDYTKAFVWIITNCRKLLKKWEYQTTLPVS